MELAELIRNYVDKAIEYEFAVRDVDEDGYTSSANAEKTAREEAFMKLKEYCQFVIKYDENTAVMHAMGIKLEE